MGRVEKVGMVVQIEILPRWMVGVGQTFAMAEQDKDKDDAADNGDILHGERPADGRHAFRSVDVVAHQRPKKHGGHGHDKPKRCHQSKLGTCDVGLEVKEE